MSQRPRSLRRPTSFASECGPLGPLAAGCLVVLGSLLVGACSSTRDRDRGPEKIEVQEIDPKQISIEEQPIGKFLADFDVAMQAWSSLSTTASTEPARRQARELESVLVNRATKRFDDLVEQLESGPPHNRIRAASALGFSGRTDALPPLLAALSDPYDDVVNNALLGLALLGDKATPVEPLCNLLATSPDPHARSNAGYALRRVIGAGAEGAAARMPARLALSDNEPFVRVQVALVLGLLGDAESIPALADQVYDELPLVANAAVEALLLIAEHDPINRGPVARALVPARKTAGPRVQDKVRRALVRIAGVDYGKDAEPWLEWANRLP